MKMKLKKEFKHNEERELDKNLTPSMVLKQLLKEKVFIGLIIIFILGNILGGVFLGAMGSSPDRLGNTLYSQNDQVILPNSTRYYTQYLNGSKNSINFQSNINLEFYLFDQPVNKSQPLSEIQADAIYTDNDARCFSKYLSKKGNYTLVIITHEEKKTEFSCAFKEYTYDEQEEITYYNVGKWLMICSYLLVFLYLCVKMSAPWIRQKNLVTLTLYTHEVTLIFKQWIQKLWIFVIFIVCFSSMIATPNIEVIPSILIIFVFFGPIIAAVPAASTISGEIGGIADSLLSKSVKRWQYLLSKFLSHFTVILIIYTVTFSIIIGIMMAQNQFPTNLDYEQLVIGLCLIGLSLVLFATFGVLFSTLFSKPLYAIIMCFVIWYALIFMMQASEWMYSPATILGNFGKILGNSWDVEYWKIFVGYLGALGLCMGGAIVAFNNKDL
jgi:ABC-type transport system involved in multi-copper enzyme maturation permease subunit